MTEYHLIIRPLLCVFDIFLIYRHTWSVSKCVLSTENNIFSEYEDLVASFIDGKLLMIKKCPNIKNRI